MTIAVTGCRKTLPPEFPLELKENSGNMVHANAPFEMFDTAIDYLDGTWRASGARSFAEYVSRHSSHLIVTMANSFRAGERDGTRYTRFIEMIEQYDKPIVVFGLGVQAPTTDVSQLNLHPEAIRMMRVLGDRSTVVGVRGETTAAAFRELAGVTNTFVTGCPSFFSRPQAFEMLARNVDRKGSTSKRIAYSPTKLNSDEELALLYANIRADSYYINVGNPQAHAYYLHVTGQDGGRRGIPPYLKPLLDEEPQLTRARARRYFRSRYKLFRDPREWYAFNEEHVAFTYGTRFHVNMASILSGVPALWLTHDARTEELTSFLHLPAMRVHDAVAFSPDEAQSRTDYTDLLSHVPGLFTRFNEYLALNGLPDIPAPRL